MGSRRFSDEQERCIRLAYEAGESSLVLAEVWGTNHHTIKDAVRRAGGQIRRQGGPRKVGNRVISKPGVLVTLSENDPMYDMDTAGRGRVLEHRLVMARHLGRPLRSDEQVHHINGDRLDNRIENLQLRQGAHGSGVRHQCLDCGSDNVVPIQIGGSPLPDEQQCSFTTAAGVQCCRDRGHTGAHDTTYMFEERLGPSRPCIPVGMPHYGTEKGEEGYGS